MPKFTIDLWATITYSNQIEVEAEDYNAAEKMAREEHKKSNVTEEWCHSDAELDYDIFEIEEEDNG